MSNLVGRRGLFAWLLMAVFGLSSWCFASPLGQDASPSAGEKPQSSSEAKTSKKKKKRKKAAPAFIVLAPMPNQTVGPVQLNRIEVNGSSLPTVQPKAAVDAAATPRVGIGPAVDPQPLGVVGSIIISEFRVRGPSGANGEFIQLYK